MSYLPPRRATVGRRTAYTADPLKDILEAEEEVDSAPTTENSSQKSNKKSSLRNEKSLASSSRILNSNHHQNKTVPSSSFYSSPSSPSSLSRSSRSPPPTTSAGRFSFTNDKITSSEILLDEGYILDHEPNSPKPSSSLPFPAQHTSNTSFNSEQHSLKNSQEQRKRNNNEVLQNNISKRNKIEKETSSSDKSNNAKNSNSTNSNSNSKKQQKQEEVTRCVCGETEDFGIMVSCSKCKVWQHVGCVGYSDPKKLPPKYYCELCKPEGHPYFKLKQDSKAKSKKRVSRDTAVSHQSLTNQPQTPGKRRSTMNSREAAQWDSNELEILLGEEAIEKLQRKRQRSGGSDIHLDESKPFIDSPLSSSTPAKTKYELASIDLDENTFILPNGSRNGSIQFSKKFKKNEDDLKQQRGSSEESIDHSSSTSTRHTGHSRRRTRNSEDSELAFQGSKTAHSSIKDHQRSHSGTSVSGKPIKKETTSTYQRSTRNSSGQFTKVNSSTPTKKEKTDDKTKDKQEQNRENSNDQDINNKDGSLTEIEASIHDMKKRVKLISLVLDKLNQENFESIQTKVPYEDGEETSADVLFRLRSKIEKFNLLVYGGEP